MSKSRDCSGSKTERETELWGSSDVKNLVKLSQPESTAVMSKSRTCSGSKAERETEWTMGIGDVKIE